MCDGHVDCPKYQDDEKYCGIVDITCSTPCHCLGLVLNCTGQQLTRLPSTNNTQTRKLRSMMLSQNNLNITQDTFSRLYWLAKLDLSHNGIPKLGNGLFRDLANLMTLDLSHNSISVITAQTFRGMRNNIKLNLNDNLINSIDQHTFSEMPYLQHLILANNALHDVKVDTFTQLINLNTINGDSFRFCCIAPHVETCIPEPDEFSSCEDLLSRLILQVCVWILGTLSLIGNAFVIIWRIKTERKKVASFFIINLGISDLLMGVYLYIIGSVDVYYRGSYSIYSDQWRSSGLCQFAGIISMLSSEASVFMLTAMTVDRVQAILFPLKLVHIRIKHARYVAGFGWALCFFLSVLPVTSISYFGGTFYGSTGTAYYTS